MDLNNLLEQKNRGWNATTSLPCWTLRTPSLQQQPLWVCPTGRTPSQLSAPARWPVSVSWSRQATWEHCSLSLCHYLSCSFQRPNFNDSLPRPSSVCVCVHGGQQQSAFREHQQNPNWLPSEAKTLSHHLHTGENRVIAHLTFAFRVWSSLTQAVANLLK